MPSAPLVELVALNVIALGLDASLVPAMTWPIGQGQFRHR